MDKIETIRAQRKEAAIAALFPTVVMGLLLMLVIAPQTDDLQSFLLMLPVGMAAIWLCFYGVWRSLDEYL
jgi:hypothetical protein